MPMSRTPPAGASSIFAHIDQSEFDAEAQVDNMDCATTVTSNRRRKMSSSFVDFSSSKHICISEHVNPSVAPPKLNEKSNEAYIVYLHGKTKPLSGARPKLVKDEIISLFNSVLKIESAGKDLRVHCVDASQKAKMMTSGYYLANILIEPSEPRSRGTTRNDTAGAPKSLEYLLISLMKR